VPLEAIADMAHDPRARADIARSQRLLKQRRVAVDGGFSAAGKRRSVFFADYLASLHVGTYLSAMLDARGSHPSALRLTRERIPFREREVALLRRLRPLLDVCEALFDARPARPGIARLTPRQRVIVDYVARGSSNAEIALVLGISPNTVRNRLADAFERLGVTNRAELVAVALAR